MKALKVVLKAVGVLLALVLVGALAGLGIVVVGVVALN